jgi:hypothetical protein
VIQQLVRTVVRKDKPAKTALALTRPATNATPKLERLTFAIARQSATRTLLKQTSDTLAIDAVFPDPDEVGDARRRRLTRISHQGVSPG